MAESHTATIMVTDLVGSTEARVRLGEERADLLRRTHDDLIRNSVEAAGGTVVKGLGDGVLAMFSGASDAVGAAVAIQQAAYAHNREVPDEPLDIRVGLSAGDVSVENGDCFGTPVVEASRLCAVALGAQILAADLVRLLARGRGGHVFTASGERELKGLPEPISVVTVGWEPPEPQAAGIAFPARLAPQASLPFSGRKAQLESLLQEWKETTVDERRVVLVSGEPGIGKTRLAAEVARQVHDLGGIVLFGRCDEDIGMAFQPFVGALEQVVSSRLSAESLGRHAGELVRLVPGLAQALPGLEPPLQSDPETERYRLFDAVAAWLGALSSPAGVLLVLDDLHWAEKPTLLLLRHLVRSPEPMRLFVIGTYRDTDLDRTHPLAEVLADLRREPGVDRLALSGLDVSGITELLANASGERMDDRAGELAQILWSETEGNPFFVQEILLSLVESGRLIQREGVWTTDLEVSELGIPEGVRETVGRRLSRLSESANVVLGLASVIGAVVDVDVLFAISDLEEDAVLDALDAATAAALLRETSSGAYEFTHALVRSTLYDELSAARRARRHRQVAEALERRGMVDAAVLAYHFRRAGITDARAVDYAAAAGEQALERLAFDQAVAFFTHALEAAEDVEADSDRRCALLIRLGSAQRLAGVAAYRETLLSAAGLARDIGDAEKLAQAALANNRGFWSIAGVLDEDRIQVLEDALSAVGPADTIIRARLLALLAVELSWSDPQLSRLDMADEAVAMARRLGDDTCILEVWRSTLFSTWVADRVPALAAELPDMLELAERIGDAQQIVLVCSGGFVHSLEVGDLDLADRLLERLGRIAAEVNNPMFRWLEASYRCGRVMVSGSGDEIERAALTALEIGQDAGQPDAFVWFAPQVWFARGAQGRLAEVLDLVRQQMTDNPGLPAWIAGLAVTLVRIGEHDEAAELVAAMMADSSNVFPYDPLWLFGHTSLGEAVACVGTPEQAAEEYARLAPYADRIPYVGVCTTMSVNRVLATLAARAGQPERADEHFARAKEEHERLGAPEWVARTELEWGRFLLDAGESDRARTLLARSAEGAKRIGAADVVRGAGLLLGDAN